MFTYVGRCLLNLFLVARLLNILSVCLYVHYTKNCAHAIYVSANQDLRLEVLTVHANELWLLWANHFILSLVICQAEFQTFYTRQRAGVL